MQTALHEYEHHDPIHERRTLVRASQAITIPRHLQRFIAFVNINTHPLHLRSLSTTSRAAMMNSVAVDTLSTIRETYGIPDDLVVTNTTNIQALPSFYAESWNPNDLQLFIRDFWPKNTARDPPIIIAKGTRENIPTQASTETSLDLQYMVSVARNATTMVWTMDGRNPFSYEDEPFVAFAQSILDLKNPPYVVSISYSDDEEHIFNVSPEYARSLDVLLIKMGLRGISVLIASGDDGVAGLRPEFEKLSMKEACQRNGPQWPSSSPYITTVGATMHLEPQFSNNPFFLTDQEVVCSSDVGGMITTGGAFSNIYRMPPYQQKAVMRYLNSEGVSRAPSTFFNASGRAYPDISALGANFVTYLNGELISVSGTSASTPVIGAMVTLWNDIRLNGGNSSLGFLNPLIYYLAEHRSESFQDVVVGNNGAGKQSKPHCKKYFQAGGGWDAVSGVGTPNFQVISEFIRSFNGHFNLTVETPPDIIDRKHHATSSHYVSSTTISMSDFGAIAIIVLMIVTILWSLVMLFRCCTRRRNRQYASLEVDGAAKCPTNTIDESPRGKNSRTGGRRQHCDSPVQDDEGDDMIVEMNEINLHEG